MADLNESFAAWVRRERERRGVSLRELARRVTDLGLTMQASQIARIEAGERAVRLAEVEIIADALGSNLRGFMAFHMEPLDNVNQSLMEHDSVFMDLLHGTVEAIARLEHHRRQGPEFRGYLEKVVLDAPPSAEKSHLEFRFNSMREDEKRPWYDVVSGYVRSNVEIGENGPFKASEREFLASLPWPTAEGEQ